MANLVSRKAKGSSATADMKRRDLAFWTRRLKALPRNKEAQRERREEKRRERSDGRQASFNLAPYKAMNN
jgi:hypothetical protein